jgi:Domain of unknown function (DUF4270)
LKNILNFMTVCFKGRINLFAFTLLVCSFTFTSCRKNESTVGTDLVDGITGFNLKWSDTSTLVCYTTIGDSFPTRDASSYILGKMNDPELGIATASLISEFTPPTSLPTNWDNTTIAIDSVVLQLKFLNRLSYYGNLTTSQTIRVYELGETLNPDSSYRTDRNYAYNPSKPLGTWNGSLNKLEDSVSITLNGSTVTLPPHIRIRLDDADFLNRFKTTPTSTYASIVAFKSVFKGLIIQPETTPLNAGEGGMVNMEMRSNAVTSVVLYYDGTQKVEFPLSDPNNAIRYNQFKHEHLITLPIQAKNMGSHRDVNYVKSMGGLKTRILIPFLFDYIKSNKIMVNKAEVIIPIVPGTNTGNYLTPTSMRLFSSDSLGRNELIADVLDANSLNYYGGGYNSSTQTYTFNIMRHVQQTLNSYAQTGLNSNYGLNLFIQGDNPVSASRVILDTRPGKVKLKLSYTVIE